MTECNRCGDCCERIWLASKEGEVVADRLRAVLTHPDIPEGDNRRVDAAFILAHWTPFEDRTNDDGDLTGQLHTCDMFDPATRLCTAHDDRPPVCKDYPWYGHNPAERTVPFYGSPRCSFLEDIPVTLRPK